LTSFDYFVILLADKSLIMRKHKLIELRKINEERIASLTEEVEITTNAKLSPL